MDILNRPPKLLLLLLLGSLFLLSACKDEISTAINQNPISTSSSISANLRSTNLVVINHPGRLLASNCFQCHGTNGNGLEHLAGKSANEIISELNEMKAKNPRSEIMNVHAKAYTTDEIKLIADFFSKQ